MIYFSLKEIYVAVISFFLLGVVSSFVYFLLVFLKAEYKVNTEKIKLLAHACPRDYKSILKKNVNTKREPMSDVTEFLFTIFIGIVFIIFTYVFLDGLFRFAFLLIFCIGFFISKYIFSLIEPGLLLLMLRLLNILLYCIFMLFYPMKVTVCVILSRVFFLICAPFALFHKFFKLKFTNTHFVANIAI